MLQNGLWRKKVKSEKEQSFFLLPTCECFPFKLWILRSFSIAFLCGDFVKNIKVKLHSVCTVLECELKLNDILFVKYVVFISEIAFWIF